ncbi:hypothetical protein AAVH_16750 [Aphelenchoides avenae]|nr:hypothetical protein AAVH_16750 [Aphelenchus avenae]
MATNDYFSAYSYSPWLILGYQSMLTTFTLLSVSAMPLFVFLIWKKSTKEMRIYRVYLLMHCCCSFTYTLITGLGQPLPLFPFNAAVVTGPLRALGNNRGLFFFLGITSAAFMNTFGVVLFVFRYTSLLDASRVYWWLSSYRRAPILLVPIMVITPITLVIPLTLSIWNTDEIKENVAKLNPVLGTFIADKVVFGFRSGPTSTIRYSGYALSFWSLFDALVELFCVMQSFRLIRRNVQKSSKTWKAGKNLMIALVLQQAAILVMVYLPKAAYVVCFSQSCEALNVFALMELAFLNANFLISEAMLIAFATPYRVALLRILRRSVRYLAGFLSGNPTETRVVSIATTSVASLNLSKIP